MMPRVAPLLMLFQLVWMAVDVVAQQVTVAAPASTFSQGYFENLGVHWGYRHRSANGILFFRNGGAVLPPFGNLAPAAQSGLGIAGVHGNRSWNLQVRGFQGSDRSISSTTPLLTMPNGGVGWIGNTVQRPFVMGLVPTVGQLDRRQARQRFASAADVVSRKKAAEQRREAEWLAQQKAASKKTSSSATPMDPPLVLGPKSSRTTQPDSTSPGPGHR